MTAPPNAKPVRWPFLAWLAVALAGIVAPAIATLVIVNTPGSAPFVFIAGPILSVGMMGAGMIAAAIAGRLWIGVVFAIVAGAGLITFARALGMPPVLHPLWAGLALIVAGISFAARGALFARSAADKGWWVAGAVVAGEGAMLFTASALPGALPDWLLALLPAQWASTAIQVAFTGTGTGTGTSTDTRAASSALLALAGTAAATLFVARLWPRRWPYLIMFSAWLGLSALVWHQSSEPVPRPDRNQMQPDCMIE